jgi:hypothetical protein
LHSTPWDEISALANVFIALGVIGVFLQVWVTTKQHRSNFEDELNREYREISRNLPIAAMLGEGISPSDIQSNLKYFLNYFDLTNEEILFRQVGRISKETWQYWRDGIRENLQYPAFSAAWSQVKSASADRFQELRKLEESRFEADPKDW